MQSVQPLGSWLSTLFERRRIFILSLATQNAFSAFFAAFIATLLFFNARYVCYLCFCCFLVNVNCVHAVCWHCSNTLAIRTVKANRLVGCETLRTVFALYFHNSKLLAYFKSSRSSFYMARVISVIWRSLLKCILYFNLQCHAFSWLHLNKENAIYMSESPCCF